MSPNFQMTPPASRHAHRSSVAAAFLRASHYLNLRTRGCHVHTVLGVGVSSFLQRLRLRRRLRNRGIQIGNLTRPGAFFSFRGSPGNRRVNASGASDDGAAPRPVRRAQSISAGPSLAWPLAPDRKFALRVEGRGRTATSELSQLRDPSSH